MILKIGIVTFEYPKLNSNGGIGTAYDRLSEVLAAQGHQVTIFFVDIRQLFKNQTALVKSTLKYKKNIDIKIIPLGDEAFTNHSWTVARSLSVFQKLINESFDVLHFHDCMGFSWAISTIKKLGIAFQETQIVLGMHGPNFWVDWAHDRKIGNPIQLQEYELEKLSFETADVIVSPSQYLLDFLQAKGWQTLAPKYVIPNCNRLDSIQRVKIETIRKPNELIFFGRLEPRKGVQIFTQAVQKFFEVHSNLLHSIHITYLGRDRKLNSGELATNYVLRELKPLIDIGLHLKIISDFDSNQCKEYFAKSTSALIVMPSTADNSPYVIVECLEQSLNFICSKVGGQTELLDSQFVESHTFAPNVDDLFKKIVQHTTDKLKQEAPKPSTKLISSNLDWIRFHEKMNVTTASNEIQSRNASFTFVVKASENVESMQAFLLKLDGLEQAYEIHFYFEDEVYNQFSFEKQIEFKKMYTPSKKQNVIVSDIHLTSRSKLFKSLANFSSADYLLFLSATDHLTHEGRSAINRMCLNNADLILFGMDTGETRIFPPPVSIKNDVLYDSISKFPLMLKKDLIEECISKEFIENSASFSLKTENILKLYIDGKNIVSAPIILIRNLTRESYDPNHAISEEQFKRRIHHLSESTHSNYIKDLAL